MEKGERVGAVIAKMRKRHIREVPVVDASVPLGLVSYTTLVARRSVPLSARIEAVMVPCPKLDQKTKVVDVAEALMSAGIRGAPVVRGERIIGFVSRTDIVRAIGDDARLKKGLVRNVMTRDPISVAPDDSVKRATALMDNLNEKALPVVDEEGAIVGVVGMAEFIDAVWRPKALRPPRTPKPPRKVFGDREPTRIKIGSIMTRTPIAVAPDDTVADVVSMMLGHGIATVFVKQHGRLVGVVSQADLMELVVSLRRSERVYVQISGLDTRDACEYAMLDAMISNAAKRISRIDMPQMLSIHVLLYRGEGTRAKYSLRGRLVTRSGLHHAKSSGWDLSAAANVLLGRLYDSVVDKRQKQVAERRGRRPSL